MKITNQLKLAAAVAAGMTLIGCGSSSSDDGIKKVFNCTDDTTSGARVICIGEADDLSDSKVQTELMDALLSSETGDTFVFPQGRYQLTQTIAFQGKNGDNVDVDNLTFKGAGMDKTIFDVSGASADGFKLENTDNLVFEDFGVYESNNNAIKVIGSDGVIMRRVATVWETDYQATNGAYGLYPVESSNILIEDSFVKGSADAGIYVGQSSNIVVRNNIAEKNVAGIEIENSNYADVYNNIARGNTGGILVFDLPIGNGKYGSDVRVFDNIIEANNAPNFAAGCTDAQVAADTCFEGGVHIVPPGTGVIVLSTSNVEIYENTITDHKTIGVAITSYMMPDDRVAEAPKQDIGGIDLDLSAYGPDSQTTSTDDDVYKYSDLSKFADKYLDGWSPFVNGINIHDNTITVAEGVNAPEGKLINDLLLGVGSLQSTLGIISGDERTQLPSIFYDGVGELLAVTPYGETSNSIMATIAGGIDGLAQLLDAGTLESDGARIPSLEPFSGSLYGTDASSVCQSANLDANNAAVNAAAIYATTPSAGLFSDSGTPYSKVELAIGALQQETPDTATAMALANSILNDDSMTCSGTAYKGSASTATINGVAYGCGSDDNGDSCSL
ncbi:parallel beta-helix domain-containing protein [Bermanella sp. WJH001]|uniref:parallel beta-helix domain-containing protein n=1 Tax=Bermanella sp. WJH001 TaxID=3048005 RepID=UPI0024BEFCDE|nr:parallel beta-helix domain-containing protein [Bermanella sp. WJH001]MDJ1539375.1 parallel beta-helix domain-containing protein [Bermanella sp. WJH001]